MSEIETQCQVALNAALTVNAARAQLLKSVFDKGEAEVQQEPELQRILFRNLHSLLTHASNVSRLLWPAFPVTEHPKAATGGHVKSGH